MALEAGIVVGGVTHALLHPETGEGLDSVLSWRGNSPSVPEFRAGDGYNKPRGTNRVDAVVWHWTGGEAEPPRMAETLRKRKLGVEFAIGRDGRVYQFCDPAFVDTADAGILNARSVGVEIVCYGYAGGWTWDPIRAVKVPRVPPIARDREVYDATTHGRRVKTAHFYPTQITAALALADALSRAFAIPRVVPTGPEGEVIQRALGPHELRGMLRFQGHLGHYHVTEAKRDPGPRLMEALRAHFAQPGITTPLERSVA